MWEETDQGFMEYKNKGSTANLFRYESFNWLTDILPLPYRNVLKIVALNAGITRNLSVYVEEEMQRAARTLIEKPVFYGRTHNSEDKRVVGSIAWAEYEDSQLECIAVVEPEIYNLVKNEEVQRCSIETRFIYPEQVNGIRVHGLIFDGLLLVPYDVEVGDSQTSVTTLNRLYETLSQTQRQIDVGGRKEMSKNSGQPRPEGNGSTDPSGSKPPIGDGDLLTNQMFVDIEKRFHNLTETLRILETKTTAIQESQLTLSEQNENLIRMFEKLQENLKLDILVEKTRNALTKEFGVETKPQGKGIVADVNLSEVQDFSDLLRPNSSGQKGGQ